MAVIDTLMGIVPVLLAAAIVAAIGIRTASGKGSAREAVPMAVIGVVAIMIITAVAGGAGGGDPTAPASALLYSEQGGEAVLSGIDPGWERPGRWVLDIPARDPEGRAVTGVRTDYQSLLAGCVEVTGGPMIRSLDDNAFYCCGSIESVSLPAVEEVGSYAFGQCGSLESVSLPAATSIGRDAFYCCGSLESVSLPAATSIGRNAFYYCGPDEIELPSVEELGSDAFLCSTVGRVSLPNTTVIKKGAFSSCLNLESVSAPKVATLEANAFDNCPALKSLDLPALTAINNSFSGLYGLEELRVPALEAPVDELMPALKIFEGGAVAFRSALSQSKSLRMLGLDGAQYVYGGSFRNFPVIEEVRFGPLQMYDSQNDPITWLEADGTEIEPTAESLRDSTFRGSGWRMTRVSA